MKRNSYKNKEIGKRGSLSRIPVKTTYRTVKYNKGSSADQINPKVVFL